MLGTIHDKWEKAESVDVNEGDNFVIIRGKRVEVKLEEENRLRLSLVEMVNYRNEQHNEAVAEYKNVLVKRHKDLASVKEELKQIIYQLDDDELDADVEEDLERQARAKRAAKRKYAQEIKKLEGQTSVSVNYRIVKTGFTALLPPGLTLHPKFLSEPVCWCPYNMPASNLVEETTTMFEEMPLTLSCARQTTASGPGLKYSIPNEESKFVITAKDFDGKPRSVGGDKFVVESKEAELKSSVFDKKNGMYDVLYSAADLTEGEHFSLVVTLRGDPIRGSPFSVRQTSLLLEFSTVGSHSKDWLDAAVETMSDIPRARLWVQLSDMNGSVVYKSTGVTNCKWTQNRITAPNRQYYDDKHINAIRLDNGDRMLIIGKTDHNYRAWGIDAYRSYNIIINAGWDSSKVLSYSHPRRMIIALKAPDVKGWTAPDNLISFSETGFIQTQSGNWPKFNGTFRIYYESL